MYQPIDYEKLVPGTKYKIGRHFTGIFEREFILYPEYSEYIWFDFSDVRKDNIPIPDRTCFSSLTIYYEFVPQHPQAKMERRAVNLIVRRLIGDEYFEW
jgi:hypothetical protein